MPAKKLKNLFILSLIAALGLLGLQLFWITKNWQDTTSIVSKQLNYHFLKAVEEEYNNRVGSFYNAMHEVIHSEKYHYYTYKNTNRGLTIMMHNVNNPKDVTTTKISIIHDSLPVEEKLKGGMLNIVKEDVWKEVRANILNDYYHIMYTRMYDSMYWKFFNELKLDTAALKKRLVQRLKRDGIGEEPTIWVLKLTEASEKKLVKYTNITKVPGSDSMVWTHAAFIDIDPAFKREKQPDALYSDTVAVHFASVKETDMLYRAYTYLPSSNILIAKRTWLSWMSCASLIGLTLYCLYRMYRTIIHQKQLDEMKNDFISNMTHELKTPVATISAAVDSLQYFEGLKDPQKTERYLNSSRRELERLDTIITEVLNTTMYERRKIVLHKIPFRLNESLEEIVSSQQISKGRDFTYSIHCDSNFIILADKAHFTNIVLNILDNAIKYTPHHLLLTIKCTLTNGFVNIAFSDNGPGIGEQQLTYIFEKFYRVPAGNVHDVKGFGIGLFYVKQLTEMHGGNVSAESKPEKGTTITVHFPENGHT